MKEEKEKEKEKEGHFINTRVQFFVYKKISIFKRCSKKNPKEIVLG